MSTKLPRVNAFATPVFNALLEGGNELNRGLVEVIERMRSADAGVVRSNVGGWHSDNDFLHSEDASVQRLQTMIRDVVNGALASTSEGVPPRFALEAWANVLGRGHYHSVHCHPNAIWSGCYYVTGNPGAGDAFSGKLELLDPRLGASVAHHPGSSLYGRFLLDPRPGQIIVFPGWLQHQVHPHAGDAPRITVAFNAVYAEN